MRGTGKAEIFVMLAHPVAHAKSPGIFNEIFEQKGLDSLMVPLSCRPEDFETFWAGITAAENYQGRDHLGAVQGCGLPQMLRRA